MKTTYVATKDLVIDGKAVAKGATVATIETDLPIGRVVNGLQLGVFAPAAPAEPAAEPKAPAKK